MQATATMTEYQTRQWKVYEIANDVSPELAAIGLQRPPMGLSDTECYHTMNSWYSAPFEPYIGEHRAFTHYPFFIDLELIAAGLDEFSRYALMVGVLTEDWNGHPKGALVQMLFTNKNEHHIDTYMVEVR